MKTLTLSITLIILTTSLLKAQWIPQSIEFNPDLSGIYFIDSQTGWVGGSHIFSTSNGGDLWEILYNADVVGFSDICFVNDSIGWVVGGSHPPLSKSIVLHTEDGGISWEEQYDSVYDIFRSVCFTSEDNGWIAGSKLHHTTDGGNTWSSYDFVGGYIHKDVFFTNQNNGWAVGGTSLFGSIHHTSDGGETWYKQTSGTGYTLHSVFFVNDSVGWAVGEGLTIIYTNNRGETWETQYGTSEQYPLFTGVHFVDAENGWVVGAEGIIMHTTDGGINWDDQISGTENSLSGVYFTDMNNGWVCGRGTVLYTNNGGTTYIEKLPDSNTNFQSNIFPNPFSTSTTIEYHLTQPQTVTITFYNQFGKEVDRIEQKQSAGKQQVAWTPELPGGVYFFMLEAGKQRASGKVVLVR